MENEGFTSTEKESYITRSFDSEGATTTNSPPSYEDTVHQRKSSTVVPIPSNLERVNSVTVEQNQITFSWEHITVTSPGKSGSKGCFGKNKSVGTPKKTILNDVSGYCKPGELLAIMGASGAGKSTLLNTLTFRNLAGLKVQSGSRYANGVPVSPNSLTAVSAYVQQDDLFIGTLTVKEHLVFQACVRMDRDIPYAKRMERVDAVLQELGLTKCQNTLIGVQGRVKGISGGEMKRLAFASEVLTNPPLMFCDEPTSGLDSYMAQNVVEVLRTLARQGKTIVCTIHQPSSQVYALFDRVLLMAEGRVAFLGSTDEATNFFANIGLPCPMNYNPADHYIHVLAVTPGNEEKCRANVASVCDKFTEDPLGQKVRQEIDYQLAHSYESGTQEALKRAESKNKSPYKATWIEQFRALIWRSFLSVIKEPMIMQVRFMQTIVIALVLGVIYLGQEENQEGIMNINGALFLLLTNTTFQNMFAVINVFCMELPIFLREHFNGMYRTDVYYLCKQLAELPLFIITPIIFVSIFYYMVGMNPDIERFLICNLVVLLVTQVVVSFGYFISCVSPSLQVALALAPPLIIPVMLFGGFFLNSASVPDWLIWLKYLSWFLYSNELLVINQWDNVTIACNEDMLPANHTDGKPLPCISNGDAVFQYYGFDKDNYAFDFYMLAVLAIGFRLLGFFSLLAKTYRKSK